MNSELLMVFGKVPRPGTCKTRLAASVGEGVATALSEAFLRETLRVGALAGPARDLEFHFSPPEETARAAELASTPWRTVAQTPGDLGVRMSYAFERAFSDGFRRIVAIGADSPQLQPARLDLAFEQLERTRVVLGPAEDGGYYLIGMDGPHPRLFSEVAWSSSSVLEETLCRCLQEGIECHMLPASYDVDTLPDLERLLTDLQSRPENQKLLADCRAILAHPR